MAKEKVSLRLAGDNTWPYAFRVAPVESLFVDESYQRPLSTFSRKIVDAFDPVLVVALVVSERRGSKLAVIDGQTRLAALRQLGHENAPCIVYSDLTRQDEASMFIRFQTERRGIKAYDRFKAALVAREPTAVGVEKTLRSIGYEFADGGGWRRVHPNANLMAVRACEMAFDSGTLERLLTVCSMAWPIDEQGNPLSNEIIRGMDYWLRRNEDADDDRLATALAREKTTELVKRASALREGRGHGGGSPSYMAEVIDIEYRRRKR